MYRASGTVTLRELRTYRIPSEHFVRGGRVHPDGGVIYWTDEGVYQVGPLAGPETTAVRRICSELRDKPVAAHFDETLRQTQIISSQGMYLAVHASRPWSCQRMARLVAGNSRIVSAAWVAGEWAILAEATDSGENLLRLSRRGQDTQWQRVMWLPPGNDWRFLGEAGGQLVIGHQGGGMAWSVRSLTDNTPVTNRKANSIDVLAALSAPPPGPDWRAMPVIKLRDAFLQTIADLRSDSRVLLRFASTGSLIASTLVSAPIGLMASDSTGTYVVALRQVDGKEIVIYSTR